ncbi:hypothetical protein Tco_0143000 [Tanacetum coccineum]|uniref:Uncharacterized protein n=1 Tax=Tanacetum coccineum TaxID=301880 RepID=A0ABQ5BGS6_9ASTR
MSSPDEISTSTSGVMMRSGGVRMRGGGVKRRGVGVRMRGFGVSWDSVDGEAMLGNAMGIHAPGQLELHQKIVGSMLKDHNLF